MGVFCSTRALIDITGMPLATLSDEIKRNIEQGHYDDYLGHRFVANCASQKMLLLITKKGHGYWFDNIQGQTLNWIKSRVCNEFATVQQGKPVLLTTSIKNYMFQQKTGTVKGWETLSGWILV